MQALLTIGQIDKRNRLIVEQCNAIANQAEALGENRVNGPHSAAARRILSNAETLVAYIEAPGSELVKTWTYSQLNPGGADVTHGFTFTGTDAEWTEHLAGLTHQGIEPYNAKITAPLSALGTEPATGSAKLTGGGFQQLADRMNEPGHYDDDPDFSLDDLDDEPVKLLDADTAEAIGPATPAQIAASSQATERNGTGIILIAADGTPVADGTWGADQPGVRRVYTEPATGSVKLAGLMDIDWSGPATEIRDTLVDIWFQRRQWLDRDGDKLADAEAWADEQFTKYAR